MKIQSLKGTSDYLPKETELREFIQNTILETYKTHGFQRIMTPAIEDIENLEKSDGGDNLNLIFKVLKRGRKLESAIEEKRFDELADIGLRYDLTLPLSRYYANNRQNLLTLFKCIQTDKVYRAEQPQRGRARELIQCDIDIIGSDSINCEIELISVTAKALLSLGMKNFKVKINDRNILKDILLSVGFSQDDLSSVCITFDKLDKIGTEGIKTELLEKGFENAPVEALISIVNQMPVSLEYIKAISAQTERIENVEKVIGEVRKLSGGVYDIEFDLSLVRGQGYYSGIVFEIESSDFNSSIAGGGRYDGLIGKFTNERIPAVGFSIGFERIYCILSDNGFSIPNSRKKIAVIHNDNFYEASKKANSFRLKYDVAVFEQPKKLGKFINSLQNEGFYGIFIIGKSENLEVLGEALS